MTAGTPRKGDVDLDALEAAAKDVLDDRHIFAIHNFRVAANPQTVLALIERLRKAEQR